MNEEEKRTIGVRATAERIGADVPAWCVDFFRKWSGHSFAENEVDSWVAANGSEGRVCHVLSCVPPAAGGASGLEATWSHYQAYLSDGTIPWGLDYGTGIYLFHADGRVGVVYTDVPPRSPMWVFDSFEELRGALVSAEELF
jgi:hypothetical protein